MTRQMFVIGGDPRAHELALGRMRAHFKTLDMGKAWKVTVEKYSKRRTNNQNALYAKWVDIIAINTGNDNDAVREACLKKFCPVKEIHIFGETIQECSTKYLDVGEMSVFMNRVQAWAATDLSITLPSPDDKDAK